MAGFVCIVCSCLVGGSLTSAQAAPASGRLVVEPDPLISANLALSDVNEVRVLLVTTEATHAASYEKLANRVPAELERGGIVHAKRDVGSIPRLVIRIESSFIPECDKCVYRVQGAMHRPMMLSGDSSTPVQAEVWRLKPAMGLVSGSAVADTVESAVVAQVRAFAGAVKAARQLSTADGSARQDTLDVQPPSGKPGLEASAEPLFIASKSSTVFHRPECRWAQNISSDNLVGYKTREEAIAGGKRPCKSCKP